MLVSSGATGLQRRTVATAAPASAQATVACLSAKLCSLCSVRGFQSVKAQSFTAQCIQQPLSYPANAVCMLFCMTAIAAQMGAVCFFACNSPRCCTLDSNCQQGQHLHPAPHAVLRHSISAHIVDSPSQHIVHTTPNPALLLFPPFFPPLFPALFSAQSAMPRKVPREQMLLLRQQTNTTR